MKVRSSIAAATALLALAALPASAQGSRSVYVTNSAEDTVSTFTVDRASGTLSPSPAPTTATGDSPEGVALTPDGRRLYVADYGSAAISGYAVADDGSLTELASSPFPTGANPFGLTATADGEHIYAASSATGTVSGYAIGAGGVLTPLPGSPYAAVPSSTFVASSPDSRLLYVTGDAAAGPNLAGYSIGADGALAPLAATLPDPGAQPHQPAFSPDGRFLYIADYANDSVAGYGVGSGGALSPVPGSPFAANDGPYGSLAMAPDGKNLYVPGGNSGDLAAFSVAADGSLAGVGGSPFDNGSEGTGSAVSPDGRFVYTSNYSAAPTVRGFARGAGGGLTPVPGSPFDSGGTNSEYQSLAISPDQSPRASFNVIPSAPGIKERTTFTAASSGDPDGTIVAYGWDFGDGKAKLQTDPKVHHRYREAGTYTATLTVVDDEGCSSATIYTGQTASCSGSDRSVATRSVTVADNEVDRPEISARSKQRQHGRRIVVTVKAGAREHVEAVATGTVKVKGGKGRTRAQSRGRGRGRKLALAKVKKSVKPKRQKKLKLKLKRKASNRKVFRALDDGRRVKARIFVKLTDDVGNKVRPKLVIELK